MTRVQRLIANPAPPRRMTFARRPNPVFSPEYAALRAVLVRARTRAGLSQRDLGARLGKTPSHVCRIEQGQRRVDLLEFHRIASALGLDARALFAEIAESLEAVLGAEGRQA